MKIAVEDWDELEEPRRRRDKRAKREAPRPQPAEAQAPHNGGQVPGVRSQPAPAAQARAPHNGGQAPPERYRAPSVRAPSVRERIRAAAPAEPATVAVEPEPGRTPGVAVFADDHYGDNFQNLRVPAGIAAGNVFVWLVGLLGDVVELVGFTFFVSVGLLLASYVLREWQRDRTALICLAGALPLPITIISFFT
jgi:hypothetical protein